MPRSRESTLQPQKVHLRRRSIIPVTINRRKRCALPFWACKRFQSMNKKNNLFACQMNRLIPCFYYYLKHYRSHYIFNPALRQFVIFSVLFTCPARSPALHE